MVITPRILLVMILQVSVLVYGRPIPFQRRMEPSSPMDATIAEMPRNPTVQEMPSYQGEATSRSLLRRVIAEYEDNVPANQCRTKCEADLQSHSLLTEGQLATCTSLCQNSGIVGSTPSNEESSSTTSSTGVKVLDKAQGSKSQNSTS
ncbi:hypothetical protein FB446DRAFT_26944 [Lentinula raphanica]|uniref:Uncharacterized protein n=1 Tax=Lentinula raphanica TaxID=153919 RepID=A0AA38PKU6_9AGAR|nr:hypothetical protein FB446DRAFT_26944 [Lentinula raphanica]KAJ3829696.1 hypothetical protein F5880DRAFT_258641 [Lentinula raphanica]KAJ3844794.1 hypothetical protein F5878DRAFT_36147 [Lentinula raphanica]